MLPNDILLHHVFSFLHFEDLHVFQSMFDNHFRDAHWVLYNNRYVPFRLISRTITEYSLSIKGEMYPSSQGWIPYERDCFSPWEYNTLFRNHATPDMAPRIYYSDRPDLDIMYTGRRKPPRKLRFIEGQKMDVMDVQGQWWAGSMVACRDNWILYHFHGWESRWDQWYPNDSLHVAPLHSVTRDWRSRLEFGGLVDIKVDGRWYVGIICQIISTSTIMVKNYWPSDHFVMEVDVSSERLMFHGAHIYSYFHSPFRVSNHVWTEKHGVSVYRYRARGGETRLVDHLLSETEKEDIFPIKN